MIIVRPKITKESILEKVTEDEIYQKYFQSFKIGKKYCSPFRDDPVPSFVIKNGNRGLYHMDFGKTELKGDCFNFVMQKFGLNFSDAIKKISEELNLDTRLISPERRIYRASTRTDFRVVPREFTSDELSYWNILSIEQNDLTRECIYAIDKLYVNGNIVSDVGEIRFAYLFVDDLGNEYIKVYTPYAKDKTNKFRTNVPGDLISGWDKVKNGGKNCIITKSKKDEIILTKILPTTCSLQSENIKALNPEKINFFQENYDNVFILFDPDETGLASMEYYSQFGFKALTMHPRLYQDGIKDIADLTYNYGIGSVVQFLKKHDVI